jgi:hypothetical protein
VPLSVVSRVTALAGEAPGLELHYDRVAEVLLRDADDRREAKRRLFEACRKPVDGVVSRHLNRHISIAISKLVVDTPISPNAMTGFTFSLALVAAAFAVQGGYWPTVAAAFLMQWNSILDGCDGELARVAEVHGALEGVDERHAQDPLDQVVHVAKGAALRTVAEDRQRLPHQRLGDEARDDSSVVEGHARPVRVEDPRDSHLSGKTNTRACVIENKNNTPARAAVAARAAGRANRL